MQKVDPVSAEKIHPNNVKRVIRALEVYETTGKPISQHQMESRQIKPEYDYKIFGIEVDRDVLYSRIDVRVDKMMEMGLYEEVENILNKGYSPDLVSLQGIGYKEIIMAIQGECTLGEAVDKIKLNTRHLAKRQMTWFRKTENLKWMKTAEMDKRAMIKKLSDALNLES